ncbi:MAG: hypothetical protein AAF669_08870 [Pseudomonadota bacterium]
MAAVSIKRKGPARQVAVAKPASQITVSERRMMLRTDLYDSLMDKLPAFAESYSLDPIVCKLAELLEPHVMCIGEVQWFQSFLRSTLDSLQAEDEIQTLQGLHDLIDSHASPAVAG